jgi:Dolichyl-phosphate-mannose-protein mannosyltransferase
LPAISTGWKTINRSFCFYYLARRWRGRIDQGAIVTAERFVVPLYLIGMFLIGIGYLAIVPVFEGLDETAHYSSIRQITDIGTIPIYGASFVDEAIRRYQGPLPDIPGYHYLSYDKFFSQPELVKNYSARYRQTNFPAFQPSQELNWEAQHPPLYYALLAIASKITEQLPFVTYFFLLRLFSFLLALAGVALAVLAFRQADKPITSDPIIVGFMVYPIMFPMFFPEFARIGNDALCLFFTGLTVFMFARWLRNGDNKTLMMTGVVLGLGLLTKAFFLPIIAALSAFLFLRWLVERPIHKTGLGDVCKDLARMLVPALLIGGGWYGYKLMAFGDLIGSHDAILLSQKGGLIAGLKQNFSLGAMIHGGAALFKSYLWGGTQSLAKLPALLYAPLVALLALAIGAFCLNLQHVPSRELAWMPVLLLVFFGGGLLLHILIDVASNGSPSTPGWYLHILMPWVAPMLGIGISSLLRNGRTRPLVVGLLLYAVGFQIAALWAELAFFAGCATKTEESFYAFTGRYFCLDQASTVIARMDLLGWPLLAAISFGTGLAVFLLLARMLKLSGTRTIPAPG